METFAIILHTETADPSQGGSIRGPSQFRMKIMCCPGTVFLFLTINPIPICCCISRDQEILFPPPSPCMPSFTPYIVRDGGGYNTHSAEIYLETANLGSKRRQSILCYGHLRVFLFPLKAVHLALGTIPQNRVMHAQNYSFDL